MSPRFWPALNVDWPAPPAAATVERLLAAIDDARPTAVEDHQNGVRVFFQTPVDRDSAATLARACDPLVATSAVAVPDEAWAERSQASLGPVSVGAVTVTPPWASTAGQAWITGAVTVIIQPSMGFGTGHHQSTRLCLRLLQELRLSDRSVLDVGTGSGVLAITAWRLGAHSVVAIDFDPDALASARENAALNDAGDSIEMSAIDLTAPDPGLDRAFDVVLANLTGTLLAGSVSVLRRWLNTAGTLIASGFQREDEDAVTQALAAAGLEIKRRVVEDDWVAVAAVGSASAISSSPTAPTAN